MRKGFVIMLLLCMLMAFMPYTVAQAESKEPRVTIVSYEVMEDYVEAGAEFTLSMTVKNMNMEYDVESILITGVTENNEIIPAYGTSNQCYIAHLGPEEEKVIEFKMYVQEQVQRYSVPMKFSIDFVRDFVNETEKEETKETLFHYASMATISIPISGVGKLNVNEISAVEKVIAGTPVRVNTQLENRGEVLLENVVMHVSGDVVNGSTELAIGMIEAQTRVFNEFYIECSNIGENRVFVYFTYNDATGSEFQTEKYQFNVVKEEKTGQSSSEELSGQQDKKLEIEEWKLYVLSAIVILVIGSVFVASRRKKR